ncbi:methyltransferase [Actinoplanes sp. SE50]|uniref:class I SAM-dependent methyltransferase n=1 Tax=unclassified Actinoplanes TaxID=2626549 RepID=UPI00023EC378|nr:MULTISPECIES: class I SAM-dependent methyltransferase [unclassified Actinoplanes]AEV87562.1 3-demethylubiquinone-9 3-methyltransferase [Actinoplanes sp. SE50/110]ATO85965.1 methyltransferase [Actinoplanes sp. SE50]SLM03379.1 methyltransferase [Actinoplanes sp. SE50/110]
MTDYLTINRANWDERATPHAESPDYRVADLVRDPAHLSDVVRFDLPLLGDITGQRGVHLQCHIGTDTLSLSRRGARMTGLDFSGESLRHARALATAAHADIDYVQSDVYSARDALGGGFDLVYTGIGALGWLPDIRRWASTVASLLVPGGRLFLREGHPMLWTLDYDREDDVLAIVEPYFEQTEPLVYDEPGTYVATDHRFVHTVTHEWNHGLGEIVSAVLDAGLTLTGLVEHRSVPWNALPRRMRRLDGGEWQLTERPERLPHTYTLQARRPV